MSKEWSQSKSRAFYPDLMMNSTTTAIALWLIIFCVKGSWWQSSSKFCHPDPTTQWRSLQQRDIHPLCYHTMATLTCETLTFVQWVWFQRHWGLGSHQKESSLLTRKKWLSIQLCKPNGINIYSAQKLCNLSRKYNTHQFFVNQNVTMTSESW